MLGSLQFCYRASQVHKHTQAFLKAQIRTHKHAHTHSHWRQQVRVDLAVFSQRRLCRQHLSSATLLLKLNNSWLHLIHHTHSFTHTIPLSCLSQSLGNAAGLPVSCRDRIQHLYSSSIEHKFTKNFCCHILLRGCTSKPQQLGTKDGYISSTKFSW